MQNKPSESEPRDDAPDFESLEPPPEPSDTPALERLGPPPFPRSKFPFIGLLATIYDHVAAHAQGREKGSETD